MNRINFEDVMVSTEWQFQDFAEMVMATIRADLMDFRRFFVVGMTGSMIMVAALSFTCALLI